MGTHIASPTHNRAQKSVKRETVQKNLHACHFFHYSLARRWNFQDTSIPEGSSSVLAPLNSERWPVIVIEPDGVVLESWASEGGSDV
jgi:hypothetical protein